MTTRFRVFAVKRWTVAAFALSASLLAALLGVFLPGAEHVVDVRLAFMFVGSAATLGFAFRFPRAFGLPLLAVGSATALFLAVTLQQWTPYTGEEPFLRFVVRSGASKDELKMEIIQGRARKYETITGDSVGFEIELLQSTPYWFFSSQYARLRSPNSHYRPASTFLADQIPGWTGSVARSESTKPREFYTYALFIRTDGSLDLLLEPPSDSRRMLTRSFEHTTVGP